MEKKTYSYRTNQTGKVIGNSSIKNSTFRSVAKLVDQVNATSPVEIAEMRSKVNKYEIVSSDLCKATNSFTVLNAKTQTSDATKAHMIEINKQAGILRDNVLKMQSALKDDPKRPQPDLQKTEESLAVLDAEYKSIVDAHTLTPADRVMIETLSKKISELQARKDAAMSVLVMDCNKDATWGSVKDNRLLIGVYAVIVAISELDREILPTGVPSKDEGSESEYDF